MLESTAFKRCFPSGYLERVRQVHNEAGQTSNITRLPELRLHGYFLYQHTHTLFVPIHFKLWVVTFSQVPKFPVFMYLFFVVSLGQKVYKALESIVEHSGSVNIKSE